MMRCGVASGKTCCVELRPGGLYVLNDVTTTSSRGALCIIALLYTRLE